MKDKMYVPEKKKSTAVLLAVLFGLFSWVYTYKADAWKFWLNLPLVILTAGFWGIIVWLWAIIDALIKPESFYKHYYRIFK